MCFRKSLWYYGADDNCTGKTIRWICHLGVEDLPKVRNEGCLMANKFDFEVDSAAILCQAKEVVRLTRLDVEDRLGE